MTDPRKTPWLVLGLDPSWFTSSSYSSSSDASSTSPADHATRAALVRRAYRRALLQHHPDKQMRTGASSASTFTVDDIKAAYVALGGDSGAAGSAPAPAAGALESASAALETTATGLEIVDLDELPYDEATQTWYRACRCGNPRGYTFGERDLEEELDAEAMEELLVGGSGNDSKATTIPAGELLVGCQDCSLWLCVHFAVAPDGGEDDDDDDDGEEA